MDIAHARTFLAISELGSFVRAADRLNVTQSTVSARIKVLEDELGTPLFARSKVGVSLTPAGAQFERHAQSLIRIWQQARQEVALPSDQRQILTIGAQFSLWDGVLLDWLCGFRRDQAEIAIRAEVGSNEELMRRLVDGLLDVAVIYTPQTRPGLIIEQLLEETLVLVGTQPHRSPESINDYVYIDWGVEFRTSHAIEFPSGETSGLFVGLGVLGLEFILRNGGTGYFPIRVVRPLIDDGRLHLVHGAPRFHRPAYLVYYPDEANPALGFSVELLRDEGRRANRVQTPHN